METIDKIFVINLPHRTDRYQRFTTELAREEISNWELFKGIIYDPNIHGYKNEFDNFLKGEIKTDRYLKAAFGCMLSHYSIIKIAKERGYKNVAILEDDFIFTNGWRENLAKCMIELSTKNWFMFYFHMGYYGPPPISISNNLVIPVQGLGTTGYILKSEIYDFMIENMLKYGKQIDVFYYQRLQRNPFVLAAKYNIMIQGESYSDIEFEVANKGGR